jgi:hypothetical protein
MLRVSLLSVTYKYFPPFSRHLIFVYGNFFTSKNFNLAIISASRNVTELVQNSQLASLFYSFPSFFLSVYNFYLSHLQ